MPPLQEAHDMRRWDFVAAYLQGELLEAEVVYCRVPPGGLGPNGPADESGLMCVVCKPIYGMAQAGRRWQRTLFPWLLEFGFQQSEHDRCVFTLRRDMPTPDGPRAEHVILGVYVDDCQIAYSHGDEHSLYAQFTAAMQARWAVEDEGPIEDLLGVEFADNGDGSVTLSQTSYIERLMADTSPTECRSSPVRLWTSGPNAHRATRASFSTWRTPSAASGNATHQLCARSRAS